MKTKKSNKSSSKDSKTSKTSKGSTPAPETSTKKNNPPAEDNVKTSTTQKTQELINGMEETLTSVFTESIEPILALYDTWEKRFEAKDMTVADAAGIVRKMKGLMEKAVEELG